MSVLGIVDAFGRGAENIDSFGIQTHGQIIGNLTANTQNGAVRLLKVQNIHDSLKRQLIEIEPVAHVVVGRYGFRIVVDHHGAPALLLDRHQGIDRTPVEFNRGTDAVCSGSEDHN